MSKRKHSYVPFYMDDWAGGTARMTRLVRSVFFDICFHNWDKNEPVSEAHQMLIFDDLGPQGQQIVNVLVQTGKLVRNPDGSVFCERAMFEAEKAYALWAKKSGGGKKGAASTNGAGTPAEGAAAEQDQEQEQEQEEGDSPLPGDEAPAAPRKTYDSMKIMDAWNAMAAANGLAQIKKMTDERRKKTRARLDDYEESEILEAIELVPQRPFCMGNNDRRWKADYDWFIRPDTVTKLHEGGAYMGGGKGSGWLDG